MAEDETIEEEAESADGAPPEAEAKAEIAEGDGAPIEVDGIDDEDELFFTDPEEDLQAVLVQAGVIGRSRSKLGCILGLFLVLLLLGGGGFCLYWFVLKDRLKPKPAPVTEPEETAEAKHERELVEKTPEMLRQRRSSLRLETALKHGGTEATEKAVDSALGFLARVAGKDGGWDSRRHGSGENVDLAMTGLALLAFVGAGQTTAEGDHKDVVARAAKYLMDRQDPKTGLIWQKGQGGHGPGYTHAICGMALVELAALDRDEAVLEGARKAVRYSIDTHQFKKKDKYGGWRYNAGEWGDTSVCGWFMMQLKVAPQAGIDVPEASLAGAARFLESVRTADKDEGGAHLHLYGYTNKLGQTPRRSVIGCLCRLYADTSSHDLLSSVDRIMKERMPVWDDQDWYYWYYGMLLTFQVDKERFAKWNLALRDLIVKNQSTEGDLAGSWNPGGDYAVYGRLFSTTMAALCLEVYYRYAPKAKTD